MNTTKFASVLAISAFSTFWSCSKDRISNSSTTPINNCRIATAIRTSGSSSVTYTFGYDDSGRVSRVAYNGSDAYTKHFTYNNKMIYVYTDAGVNSSTDTITLNSRGFIGTIKETVPNSVYNSVYTYDANGVLVSSSTQQNSYPPISVNYTFSNGDLIYSSGSDGSKDTVSYYSDKPAVIGDLNQFYQFSYYGAYYYKNIHLQKTLDSDPFHFVYSYLFDAKGNITSVISNYGASTDTLSFTYTCP